MATARLAPVRGLPILRVEPSDGSDAFLVMADLHLGLGAVDGWVQGPPESDPERLADQLLRTLRAEGVTSLLVAGDVKHPIVGVPAPLRRVLFDFFSELLSEGIRPEVILGNHDVGLAPSLPREVRLHASEGLVRGGVGIFHGHRWPSKEVLAQPALVAGHLHPGFRFAPSPSDPGAKRRCWVRTTFPPRPAGARRRRGGRRFDGTELVVLPAFHPLAGTESLNRSRPSRGRSFLFGRFLAWGTSRLYLLDGTDLGPLKVPRMPATRRARRAGPPDR